MRSWMGKIWIRTLALILFCVFSASGLGLFWLYSFAVEDGWYSRDAGTLNFADTGMCRSYIEECLHYVSNNIQWLQDPASTDLGGYGGKAFSYTVTDKATGKITADTRTEHSSFVMDMPVEIETEPASLEDGTIIYSDDGEALSVMTHHEYTIAGYVNLPVEPYQGCYREYYIFQLLFPARSLYLPGLIVSAALAAALLIFSIAAAVVVGKSGVSTLSGRIPLDLAVVALYAVVYLMSVLLFSEMNENVFLFLQEMHLYEFRIRNIFWLWYVAALAVILANQLAAGTLRSRLVLWRLTKRVPDWALTAVLCGAHLLLLLVGMFRDLGSGYLPSDWFLLAFLFDLVIIPLLVCWIVEQNRIKKASNALAAGDLTYKVDTRRLHAVWKKLGQDLNSIGDGMAAAVEEQLRSERMKTELITNVSHDLKTPLTSIINYIPLLKEESLPPETRREYLDVLERQSDKLKKLTEDVIEASKAASGVMTVNAELLDVGELVEQSVGEYAERLQAVGVEPVIHAPQGETHIWADGRLLGRVLDNFITNIIKYAQSGTRAYFDVTAGEQDTIIEVKNTSRAPLDIPADELMERFVRGDSSRGTEGSGLGLSIARSLTELMGGKLELILDGDLFKAQVTFPSAVTPPVLPPKTDP